MRYLVPAVQTVRLDAVGANMELMLREKGDEPLDLSLATSVTLSLWDERGNVVVTDSAMTVLNAATGHVLYVFGGTETGSRRRLFGTVEVNLSGVSGDTWGWLGGFLGGWLGLAGGGTSDPQQFTVPTNGHLILDVT